MEFKLTDGTASRFPSINNQPITINFSYD